MTVNGMVVAWYSDVLVEGTDDRLLGHILGSPDGQKVWEVLAILVAPRLWKDRWLSKRVRLCVRGDSITMLTRLLKMRPKPGVEGLTLLAKEMALDIADTVYVPGVAEHVPGVANVGPDVLSRRFAPRTPGTAWELPARLAGTDGCTAPLRDESYYRTLRPR